MKVILQSLGVVLAILVSTAGAGAQGSMAEPSGVVRLRIESEPGQEALASAVLVHRENGDGGVVLFFLTSTSMPSSISWRPSVPDHEGAMRDYSSNIAVIRALTETSSLVPAAVTLYPPREGASFVVVSYSATGQPIVGAQRAQSISDRSITGDRGMLVAEGCVGAPAFTEQGVFGLVSECEAGRPPTIVLLSAARGLLRRLIPGLELGPASSERD